MTHIPSSFRRRDDEPDFPARLRAPEVNPLPPPWEYAIAALVGIFIALTVLAWGVS